MTPTEIFVITGMVAGLLWEAYTLVRDGVRTISVVMGEMGRRRHPFLAYALSGLVGHFWISPPLTLARYLPEWAEATLFVAGLFGVFLWGEKNRDRLPVSWWKMFLICAFGFTVGAFVWTLYV